MCRTAHLAGQLAHRGDELLDGQAIGLKLPARRRNGLQRAMQGAEDDEVDGVLQRLQQCRCGGASGVAAVFGARARVQDGLHDEDEELQEALHAPCTA